MAIVISNRKPFTPDEATRWLQRMFSMMTPEEIRSTKAVKSPTGHIKILHETDTVLIMKIPLE